MMKFARISLVAVIAFVVTGVAAFADDTFEYKGYMRIGTQLNTSGNAPDAWGMLGAQKWTGRLGNEDQARPYQDPFFLEQTFIKNWTAENGSFAKCVVLLNYYGKPVGDNGDTIGPKENSVTNGSSDTKEITYVDPTDGLTKKQKVVTKVNHANGNSSLRIRQAYVEMGGFAIAPDTTFWVGKRYLNRQDIHILDWFLLDFSGNGAGVTNIAGLGLDLAYVQRLADTVENTTTEGNGRNTSNNLVAKYENKFVRIDASANFITNGWTQNKLDSNDAGKKELYSSQFLSAQYKPEKFFFILPGQSSVTLQYANGAQANASWFGNRVTNNYEEGWETNNKSSATYLAAVVTGLATINDNLNVNPVLAYRYYNLDRSKSDGDSTLKWKSQHIIAAVRPTYNFNANVGVAVEVGASFAKSDKDSAWGTGPASWAGLGIKKANDWSALYKVAPTLILTTDAGYWTRPQIRLGYVYTTGTSGYKSTGTGTFTNKSYAQWFFAQAEAWW